MCDTEDGLLETLSNNFKPWYNETIKSEEIHKSMRQANENVEEWLDRISIVATECNYKEIDR